MNDDVPLYRSRYPDHDVLAHADDWDPVTRRLVLDRVLDVPPIRFFDEHEAEVLTALADTVVPQDDRPADVRIPIVHYLDASLHEGRGRGYRYEDLPDDGTFWRQVAAAVDDEAQERHGKGFADLSANDRADVFGHVHAGDVASGRWGNLPRKLTVTQIIRGLVEAYYAHPYAWNEIGFPGPKFPGIYPRLVRPNPDEPREVPSPDP